MESASIGWSLIRLARSRNISPTELRRIEAAVFEHQGFFKEKWHEFFHH